MIALRFTSPNSRDLRTCSILETQPDEELLEIMQIQTFSTDYSTETEFTRYNKLTHRYEVAGGIQWRGEMNGVVTFGAIRVPLPDLRRSKSSTSRSRRFRWDNSEYKWKHDGNFLRCYDWRKRVIASYDEDTLELTVGERGYAILDQVVLTCLLHRWVLSMGYW